MQQRRDFIRLALLSLICCDCIEWLSCIGGEISEADCFTNFRLEVLAGCSGRKADKG